MHVRQIDRSIRSYLPRTTAQTGRHIRELECKRLVFLNLGEACHGPKWMQLNLGGAEAYFAWRPAESLFFHTRTRLFSQLPILACARRSLKPPQPDFAELVASWFSKPFSQGGTLTTVGWAFLAARLAARDRGSIPHSGTASAPPLFEGCRRRQAPHRVRSPPSMCATPAALSTYSEPLTPLPHTPVFTSLIWALPPLSHQPLTRAGRFRFQPPPTSFTRRCATFVTTL